MTFPAVASIVQRKLGTGVGIAFDVQAVCSGFVYALSVADAMIQSGAASHHFCYLCDLLGFFQPSFPHI